jgi:hypothetical protein
LISPFKRLPLEAMMVESLSRFWPGRALLTAALFSCCVSEAPSQTQSRQSRLVGKPAPNFQLQGAYDEMYSLDQFKGHILVMQFGSSW